MTLQLCHVGGRASRDLVQLSGRGFGEAETRPRLQRVVGPLDVEHREGHALDAERDVLGHGRVGNGDRHVRTERRAGVREEHRTQGIEPLQRVVGTVVRAVAVHPLVVAGGVDERSREAIELRLDRGEVLVGALGGARLDVADVRDESEVLVLVQFGHHCRESRELCRAVRHVPDHGEAEGLLLRGLRPPRIGLGGGCGRQGEGQRDGGGSGDRRGSGR
jgi:hypothetical protein